MYVGRLVEEFKYSSTQVLENNDLMAPPGNGGAVPFFARRAGRIEKRA